MIFLRIEKLELNKIKVTIDQIDLIDMNINLRTLRPDSPQLHSFLFKVMEKVKKETGFNPYSGQIVVEALPVGDCMELTVTKISDKKPHIYDRSKLKKARATLKNKTSIGNIFTFDSFDILCSVLLNLSNEVLSQSSYYQLDNRHCLVLKNIGLQDFNVMREFSENCDRGKLCEAFLNEHAKLIAEKNSLISMAEGISKLYSQSDDAVHSQLK